MKTIIVTLLSLIVTACGSSGGGSPAASKPVDDVATQNVCPHGELYSTNGLRDFIHVGTKGEFTMERSTAIASGFVTCTDGQNFTLTIETAQGNCGPKAGCIGNAFQPIISYTVQEVERSLLQRTFSKQQD